MALLWEAGAGSQPNAGCGPDMQVFGCYLFLRYSPFAGGVEAERVQAGAKPRAY